MLSRQVREANRLDDLIYSREHEYTALYRVYFFGQFRAFRNSELLGEAGWRRNKAKSLLKWFILNSGKLFSAEQLIELFWPDIELEAALRNLHVTMHYLRHVLEPALPSRQESSFIRRNANNFYWFEMDQSWWVDVVSLYHSFHQARELEKQGDMVKATFHYRKIAGYCEQGFLPEDTYAQEFRSYFREYDRIFLQVLTHLISIYLQQNAFDEVLDYSYQALILDPYCEQAMLAIVTTYLKQGNSLGALRKLNEFQTFLQEELGLGINEKFSQIRTKIVDMR